jgi:hypothetical protein
VSVAGPLDDKVGNQIGINLLHSHQWQYLKEERERKGEKMSYFMFLAYGLLSYYHCYDTSHKV